MDQTTLVGPDLDAGLAIVSVLESAQIKQITAVFALFAEYSDWRLVLSSPSLDQSHSLKAGQKVHQILQGKVDFELPTLMILPTKDTFLRDLRARFSGNLKSKTSLKRGKPLWFGGQTLGRLHVTDAFILSFPGVMV